MKNKETKQNIIFPGKVLFFNEYCTIYEDSNTWFRYDNILQKAVEVDSYFNNEGRLIIKQQ